MVRSLLLILCCLASAAPAETPLKRLLTADEARDWQAVGRLNLQGFGFCTGTLISETLVLTAAHCVFNRRTGKRIRPEVVHFLAGWRKSWAAAHRKARRIVVHPDYDFGDRNRLSRVATDIAVIELDQPISASTVAPVARVVKPTPGDVVSVVSYARDRSEVPSLQEECLLLGRQSEVLVFNCDVNFGASGAPIFVMQNGQPRIASVVSAMAQWNERDVTLGTSLGDPLDDLMQAFDANGGLPQVGGEVLPGRKVVTPPPQN